MTLLLKTLKAIAALVGLTLGSFLTGFIAVGIYLRITESDFIGDGVLILLICAATTYIGFMAGLVWAAKILTTDKPADEVITSGP
ncbi:MAG: hypothetical protein V4555_13295 [Acidobacteriota bacterium]